MTILVTSPFNPQHWVSELQKHFPDRSIATMEEPFDRRSVHYVVSWHHPEGSLAGLPNLSAIISLGAGVDHIFRDPRLPPDALVIRIVNHNLTDRMSEYVVLHCLIRLRKMAFVTECQQAKKWVFDPTLPSAADVRVGLMGFGVLGQDAGQKLKMMGFDVAAWVRAPRPSEDIPFFAGFDELDAFLQRTDILVCLLPLTEETRGILNYGLLEKLAQDGRLGGPFLINCGRGGCQVEADILAALDNGILKGATLDVFETEPLPKDSPLWDHPDVTITPHNSALSNSTHVSNQIVKIIHQLEAGEIPEGVVNPERGY